MSRSDSKRININNKFEYTRCILPDIGALEPEQIEKDREDEEDKAVEKIREKAKKLQTRFIEGSRRKDFPDATPRQLLEEDKIRAEEERKRKMEDFRGTVRKKLRILEYVDSMEREPGKRLTPSGAKKRKQELEEI